MSTVGLTKAKEKALRDYGNASDRMLSELVRDGFLEDAPMNCYNITPRGHAALAAPRMTQAEYALLLRLENWSGIVHGRDVTILHKLARRGLAKVTTGSSGYTKAAGITSSGRTALNNVRAAMGSPDWKEGL